MNKIIKKNRLTIILRSTIYSDLVSVTLLPEVRVQYWYEGLIGLHIAWMLWSLWISIDLQKKKNAI